MYRKIPEKDIKYIIKSYNEGESSVSIAKRYKVTFQAIWYILKNNNVKIRSQSELQRKYSINESFFDCIDSKEKAYFLGFLYADGYNNTKKNSVSISLQCTDLEILQKLNKFVCPTKPIRLYKRSGGRRKNQYRLDIINKHISSVLNSHGMVKAKSLILKYPVIDESLNSHFIRGYFDGDGCIRIGDKNTGVFSVCGTKSFLTKIRTIFIKKCNVKKVSIYKFKKKKGYELRYKGNINCTLIRNFLYKESSIYMKRKYDIFFSIVCKRSRYEFN